MLRSILATTAQRRAAGILTAAWLDTKFGGPPRSLHPVTVVRRLARTLEGYAPADPHARRTYGAVFTIGMCADAVIATYGPVRLMSSLPFVGALKGTAAGATLLALATSKRDLLDHAAEVAAALERGDLERARLLAGEHLVRHDTSELDASGVAAAAIEGLAARLSRDVVGPWCWFAIAGAPGAWVQRVTSTLDETWNRADASYEELGMTAAHLDAGLNLLPSRLTALAILAAAGGTGTRTWWRDHGRTTSPNAGHPVAALAGALEVEVRLEQGAGGEQVVGARRRPATAQDLHRAIAIARRAAAIAAVSLAIAASRRPR